MSDIEYLPSRVRIMGAVLSLHAPSVPYLRLFFLRFALHRSQKLLEDAALQLLPWSWIAVGHPRTSI